MKKKMIGIFALTLSVVMTMSGCDALESAFDWIDGLISQPVVLTDAELNAEKIIDFADGADSSVVFESDGWTNGSVFNVVWKKDNVKYEDGLLKLNIVEEKATAWVDEEEVEFDYTAGEARTQNYYGYGDYEVCMKPSANAGTASTFFTCTGPYDTKFVLDENGDYVLDENGQRVTQDNPHDEIDIEFLGKDTTKVQFNYFVNGVGGNEYMYDLGFDASEEFHEYGFRWEEDAITWFIDNVPVYKVTTDKTVERARNVKITDVLPSTPGRMLANYWCGTVGAWGWMGRYAGETKDNGTEYKWFATSAKGAPLNPVEETEGEGDEIDWSAINAITPTFGSTETYTVTNQGTSSNVVYTNVGGSSYINVEMDITQAATEKNYVHMNLTNNGTTDTQVRVNVIDSQLVAAGAQNMSTNVSATMDGVAVNTDTVWGGSFFTIPAGATVEAVVQFTGAVEKLQLMIDSSRNNGNTYAGNITVDNIKFAKKGEVVVPETPENPAPVDPADSDVLTFVTNTYTITPNNQATKSLDVTYQNVKGNSYANVCSEVANIANQNNTFSITIKNNGTESVRVRVDIKGTNKVVTDASQGASTDICNTSATGGDVWTDLVWGGSTVTVAAGAEVTVVVTYNPNGAHGAATQLLVYFASSQYDDEGLHQGSLTISNFKFSKVEA